MAERRNFSAVFKAKVALGPARVYATPAEVAARYKVHPILITKWNRQAAKRTVEAFSGEPGRRDSSH